LDRGRSTLAAFLDTRHATKVANACPTLAADGAVLFLEKIALEQVDSS